MEIKKKSGLKKKLAGIALAAGAAVLPMTTKAEQHTPDTDNAPKIQEVAKADKEIRQKQLDAVLRTGMNAGRLDVVRNETIKYIDYPKIIPVTKDGKFDEKEFQKTLDALKVKENFPHIKAYLKDLDREKDPVAAFDTLIQKISKDDPNAIKAWNQEKETINKMIKSYRSEKGFHPSYVGTLIGKDEGKFYPSSEDGKDALLWGTGMILMMALAGYKCSKGKDYDAEIPLGLAAICLLPTLGNTLATIGNKIEEAETRTPQAIVESISDYYHNMYETYTDNTIRSRQEYIIQSDATLAAKKVVESSKSPTLTKSSKTSAGRE